MKVQKMIRMQMMLVGLGATLALGGSAYAQQEVNPTTFDVNPGTPHAVSAVTQAAQSPAQANTAKSAPAFSASLWSSENTKQETDLARLLVIDTMMIVIMMIGIGLIVLYAKAATRNERRPRFSPESAPYTRANGAAAHPIA
jgi:hypothetical protein